MAQRIRFEQVVDGRTYVFYLDVNEDRGDLQDLMQRRDSRRASINRSSPAITVLLEERAGWMERPAHQSPSKIAHLGYHVNVDYPDRKSTIHAPSESWQHRPQAKKPKDGKWLGPFEHLQQAEAAARPFQLRIHYCKGCF